MTTIALLALIGSATAFDAQSVDGWEFEDEELQYLDENYEDGFDIDKVVGGEQVTSKRWMSTVGIVMNGYVGCTGTLIHPKVALTAAHCAGGISGILIDSTDWIAADQSDVIPVVDTIVHPDYRVGNDIAVLILGERVNKIPHADLALDCVIDMDLDDGSKVEVVGFGAIDQAGRQNTSKMNHGTTRVQTHDCSAQTVDGYYTGCDMSNPGSEVGAGGNGVDACFGDSGGPLYLKAPSGDYLVGVTSRAYAGVPSSQPCAYGGIYTRPDYYVKWIEEVSGQKFRYSYCNEAPDANAEGILTKPGKTGYTTVVVTDPDGDANAATLEVVEEPLHGTVTIEDGVIGFTADDDGYLGQDSFTVRVTDGGNDSYKRAGQPISMELEIPVEIDKGLFLTPSGAEGGGCGCSSTGTGAVGWMSLLGLMGLVRRRK